MAGTKLDLTKTVPALNGPVRKGPDSNMTCPQWPLTKIALQFGFIPPRKGCSTIYRCSKKPLSFAGAQVIIKVSGHQYRWLAGGYDLETGLFRSG